MMRISLFLFSQKWLAVILLISSCAIISRSGHSPFSKGAESSSSLNQIIPDLRLSPINLPPFRLSGLKDKRAIVFVMREQNCPISEKYGPRWRELEKQFSPKGVQFIYNYVGQVKMEMSAKADLEKFGFKGAYVIDKEQKAVQALSAKTTGDAFILTPDRRVVYKGPLDDQYHLLKSALQAKNHYVSDALTLLVSGKKLVPKERPAPGCVISPPPAIKKKSFLRM